MFSQIAHFDTSTELMTACRLDFRLALLVLPLLQAVSSARPRRFGDISERTTFHTVQLPRTAEGLVASPSAFSSPVGCSPKVRSVVEYYCVSGTYSVGNQLDLTINLNLFDVKVPTKSVTMGMRTTLNQGNATTIVGLAGGRATILKKSLIIFLLDGEITAETSGGGKGAYDSELSAHVSDIDLKGQLKLVAGSKSITEYNYSLPGYVYAGDLFDMGMVGTVVKGREDPDGPGANATFLIIMDTIEGSLFDWRIYAGLMIDFWIFPSAPVIHVETDIVNDVLHIKV